MKKIMLMSIKYKEGNCKISHENKENNENDKKNEKWKQWKKEWNWKIMKDFKEKHEKKKEWRDEKYGGMDELAKH